MPVCTENVCIGSVMMPNQRTCKPEDIRTKEELLPLATDFIDQYYTSIRRQVHPAAPADNIWEDRLPDRSLAGTWVQLICLFSNKKTEDKPS